LLDCSTDAVSVDVEEGLYKSLLGEGVTIITISKRLALTEFHDAELQLCVHACLSVHSSTHRRHAHPACCPFTCMSRERTLWG
jgi:ABC-type uncharacterized transport system fused permease/ATPase subunit